MASELGVNAKTIERWLKIPEFKEAIANLQSKTLTKMVAKTSDKMSDDLSEIRVEHFEALKHFRILASTLGEALTHELKLAESKGDEAYQDALGKIRGQANNLNIWNQILDRSIKLERTILGMDYEDVSVAISFLERLGYEVVDPSLAPATSQTEATRANTKGLREDHLNEIRASILGISGT